MTDLDEDDDETAGGLDHLGHDDGGGGQKHVARPHAHVAHDEDEHGIL